MSKNLLIALICISLSAVFNGIQQLFPAIPLTILSIISASVGVLFSILAIIQERKKKK